jgi:hypothetical protein
VTIRWRIETVSTRNTHQTDDGSWMNVGILTSREIPIVMGACYIFPGIKQLVKFSIKRSMKVLRSGSAFNSNLAKFTMNIANNINWKI